MNSITTKTGDAGESGLANGQRLSKDNPVFEVIGTLDEVNSWLGLVAAKFSDSFKLHKEQLYKIQDTLFYLGAEVAKSPKTKLKTASIELVEIWAKDLEEKMASNWHTQFLLPGGTELGGYLDIARTVTRRCERCLITLMHQPGENVPQPVQQYLNRLSDYLYLLRCYVNAQEQYKEKKFKAA